MSNKYCFWSFFPAIITALPDPCDPANHKEIDEPNRSIAYEIAEGLEGLCDNTLLPGWYRFVSGAGDKMPTQCAKRNHVINLILSPS